MFLNYIKKQNLIFSFFFIININCIENIILDFIKINIFKIFKNKTIYKFKIYVLIIFLTIISKYLSIKLN